MDLKFYKVLVASQRYHKSEPLTYDSVESLEVGSIVEVPLQQQAALGIVVALSLKPKFGTKAITRVIAKGAVSEQNLKLIDWLSGYYPSPSGLINSLFAPSYLLGKTQINNDTEQLKKTSTIKLPSLTTDQIKALSTINSMTGHSVILHGNTGSGKTRIYLELARQNLDTGKSVVVLTPEIGLTPQLHQSFVDSFGDQVYILHSGMTNRQRREAWLSIAKQTKPVIVIGPRSALFAPLKNIGLIVVDEMHDGAYKQEQAPYYSTTRVAGKLAELYNAKLILGSASPPVADYYVFEQQALPIIRIKDNAIKSIKDATSVIIDLKDRTKFTSSNWLSNELLDQIQAAIKKKEQSLIFLNRRGTARVILCSTCGWQSDCPRCDLPLTYHGDTHRAVCHTCGHTEPTPSSCPTCRSSDIIFKSAGTKTITTELERLFPGAIVRRFDSDLKKSERLSANFEAVKSGNVDILVGTQMLGKGLDLPKLSVVGVVLADTSLNFPDYTAEERTYQMLYQVIGRVGRGHRAGNIVIQTFHPDSKLIKQALTKDYEGFYADQIEERKLFNFPPFCFILKLSCTRRSQSGAQKSATSLYDSLSSTNKRIEIIGPSPAFSEKAHGSYTWQLIIKSSKRSRLTDIIGHLPANWTYDIDPVHLL